MESKSSQCGIKCLIPERQRFGHASNSSASSYGPLSNHLKGWLDRGNNTVSGFLISAAGAYVDHGSGITQWINDHLVDTRVRPEGSSIADADDLANLVSGIHIYLPD